MVTDPIADFLTHIRNASSVGKGSTSMPYSKLKHAIADKLVKQGYIASAAKGKVKNRDTLDIELKYEKGKECIRGLDRVSKPGRRLYCKASDLKPYKDGHGATFVSTPKGILTDEEARKEQVGGEVLFKIW